MGRACRLPVACLVVAVAGACSPSTPPPAAEENPKASDARAFLRLVTDRARQLCEARALAERPRSERPWGYPTLDRIGDAEYELAFYVWEPLPKAKGRPAPGRRTKQSTYRCRVVVVDQARRPNRARRA